MPRSVNHVASRRRRKKVLKLAKGYWGSRSKLITVVKHALDKALQYQYRDRRQRKRQFRRLWITRINAAARLNGTSYSRLINGLKVNNIEINRKVLADLAVNDPNTFTAIVSKATA